MKSFIKYSIGILLLAMMASCQNEKSFNKVSLLQDIDIENQNIALLETNYRANTKWLLARQDGIQILKSLQTYVLHKQTTSKKYSIQLLVDGNVEKELFFANKPRWFAAHELPSEPFEEFSFPKWMSIQVVNSSNSAHAIYSRKDDKKFTYKEPHFINRYQGQIKQIEAEYSNYAILWNKVHYLVKPSKVSKELKRAYRLIQSSSMAVLPLSAKVKIDKGSMEILQWDKLGKILKEDILKELSNPFREGDIIFQTSKSNQSNAIQAATNSLYSHMGIIYKKENDFFVYEAIQPVKLTPLKEWIARSENGHYVVKRLENADKLLTKNVLTKMKEIGKKYINKDYDLYFEWSNTRIYCSELVWKIYKEALGIEIGKLTKLGDFDLSHPIVKEKLEERYGKDIPLNEWVISPASMFHSDKLITVF